MITEAYMEALLVDADLADQVWEPLTEKERFTYCMFSTFLASAMSIRAL